MSNPAPATEKKSCIACGNEIPASAMACLYCDSLQSVQLCVICKKALPWKALRCNDCGAYQGRWRRHLPLSQVTFGFIAVLFGVLSTAFTAGSYLLNLDSDTKFKVASSDDAHIILKVWNTGGKPSTLIGYRLNPGHLPLTTACPIDGNKIALSLGEADEAAGNNVIVPGNPIKINLTALEIISSAPSEVILKQWANERLTLEMDVEESSDPCCLWNLVPIRRKHTRTDSFDASRIENFIKGKTIWNKQKSATPCP